MAGGRIHHWKHGWIPISPEAKAYVAGIGPKPVSERLKVSAYDDLPAPLRGKIVKRLETLTGMSEPELAARVQDNLLEIYRNADKSQGDWYRREHADITSRAGTVDLTPDQLTGMISVTSARKRWVDNKEFAQEVAQKLLDNPKFEVTQDMIDDYNSWATKRRAGEAVPHPDLKPGVFFSSDLPSDFVASKTPEMPKHLNADYVIRAVKIARGEETPDQAVGGLKQRSFINNLTDPDDPRFVTVDTWHYRAAMKGIPVTNVVGGKPYRYTLEQWADRELSVSDGRADFYGYDHSLDRYDPKNLKATIKAADTFSPQKFFQAGPSSKADNWKAEWGTYPWFVKQTQLAAQKAGISPVDFQAIVWSAVGGGE